MPKEPLSLAIFLGTYLTLAIGFFPGLRIDRTGAAIIGAGLMVGFDILTFDEAVRAVDFSTIVLLFGMMIVVANLQLSGFFRLVAAWALEHSHRPLTLLAAVVASSGVLSAFFVNDTMCLVLTPLVLEVTLAIGLNPVPYLLAVAMASNAGSVATITGNPQNMMIGSLSGIPYAVFTRALAPVAAAALVMTWGLIAWVYRKDFVAVRRVDVAHPDIRVDRKLLAKSLLVAAAMIALFFSGWAVSKAALFAGAVLLITRRVKPEEVYQQIDFSLLALFCGLFIVVAGFEKTHVEEELLAWARGLRLDSVPVLSAASAVVSNIVSNVPAVLLFRPVIQRLADPQQGWLTLSMASTLAGNFTLVGSVANLIVVEKARATAEIRFWEYFRVGAVLTAGSVAFGAFWLSR
jgi:Na+/H+ antiporter NhaD/arsenite permease-like protein